jgi:AraC-like DNA-binding protein
MKQFRYEEAKNFINKKLKSQNTEAQNARLYYFTQLSFTHYRLKNADSALFFTRLALQNTKGLNDSAIIVNAWKAAAYTFNLAGILDSSFVLSQQMLSYGRRHQDPKLTKNALNSLAALSNNNEKPEVALQYYREVYEINKRIGDTADMGGNFFNLGFTWKNLEKYDSGLWYLHKSIEHSKRFNNPDLLILTYNVAAACYRNLGNFDKQKEYLLLSNQLAEKTGNSRYTANNLYEIMMAAIKRKNYPEAAKYGDMAIRFFLEHPAPVFQATIDSLMYVAHKGMNNYAKALEYFESYVQRKNALYTEKQLKSLNETMAQLDSDKKNLIIKNQETEIISNRRYLIMIFAVAVILILLLAGLMTHLVKTRQFRHELYMKEEYLDSQIHNLHEYMEWKREKRVEENSAGPSITENPDAGRMEDELQIRQPDLMAAFYELCEHQKIYLDPDLTQEKVIKMLGTNKKYLYEAISKSTSENFKSLINRYRVNEAKKQIKQVIWNNNDLKMEDILVASGFSAPTSFYRVFKTLTGLTPSEYADETKHDLIRQKRESVKNLEQLEDAA